MNQTAGPSKREADGMIGDLFNAVVGHVGDPHPACGGGRNRNVVQPDAEPGHDLERLARRDGAGGHLGPARHDARRLMRGDERLDVLRRGRCGGSGNESHAGSFHDRSLDRVVGPGVVSEQNGSGHVEGPNSLEWGVFVDAKDPLRPKTIDAGLDDIAGPEKALVVAAEAGR